MYCRVFYRRERTIGGSGFDYSKLLSERQTPIVMLIAPMLRSIGVRGTELTIKSTFLKNLAGISVFLRATGRFIGIKNPFIIPIFAREIERKLVEALKKNLNKGSIRIPPYVGSLQVYQRPKKRLIMMLIRSALVYIGLLHLVFILTTSFLISLYAFVDPPITVLTVYRRVFSGWTITKQRPVKLTTVPSFVRRMVISVEDYKFYKHWGFDMEAFERAMQYNKALGRPMYGGSTLTMQTARTLFLVPFKSYIRKYMELIITLELELILSKNRILELYLSWAEWGRGVFGIDAASRKYFGVSVGRLSVEQAARIVALLSSPVRFMPWTLERSRILNARYIFLLDAFSQK